MYALLVKAPRASRLARRDRITSDGDVETALQDMTFDTVAQALDAASSQLGRARGYFVDLNPDANPANLAEARDLVADLNTVYTMAEDVAISLRAFVLPQIAATDPSLLPPGAEALGTAMATQAQAIQDALRGPIGRAQAVLDGMGPGGDVFTKG